MIISRWRRPFGDKPDIISHRLLTRQKSTRPLHHYLIPPTTAMSAVPLLFFVFTAAVHCHYCTLLLLLPARHGARARIYSRRDLVEHRGQFESRVDVAGIVWCGGRKHRRCLSSIACTERCIRKSGEGKEKGTEKGRVQGLFVIIRRKRAAHHQSGPGIYF